MGMSRSPVALCFDVSIFEIGTTLNWYLRVSVSYVISKFGTRIYRCLYVSVPSALF
jgi:hypothetical protein